MASTTSILSTLNGVSYEDVDPQCCFPYIRIRKISRSGVDRLVASLKGTTGGVLFRGLIPGEFGHVVKVDRAAAEDKIRHFLKVDLHLTEVQITERLARYPTWYGVVDGVHRLFALLHLIENEPSDWMSKLWPVVVMQMHPTYILRAFARSKNSLHTEKAYVASTVYDLIKSIYDEHEEYKGQVSAEKVALNALCARVCGGVSKSTSTLTRAAKLATILDITVIETIGEIVLFENERVAYSHFPPGTVKGTVDCRIYRKLFTLHNLHKANKWWKAERTTVGNRAALQRSTLRRMKKVAIQNSSTKRSFNGDEINAMYEKTILAYNEIRKLERILGHHPWPPGLKSMREAIQDDIVHDADIALNKNNSTTLLPQLLQKFQEVATNASILLKKWSKEEEHPGSTDDESSIAESPRSQRARRRSSPAASFKESQEMDSPLGKDAMLESQTAAGTDDGPTESTEDDESALAEYNITIENKSWEIYESEFTSGGMDRFQLLLTEPPILDADTIDKFVAFATRVMVPHAYVIIFLPYMQHKAWADKLSQASFDVMSWPFIVYRADQPSSRNKKFPQDVCEFAIIARAPSNSALEKNEFKPAFAKPYDGDFARFTRTQAVLGDVPRPKFLYGNRPSKRKVCATEKSVCVLQELIETYCPFDGKVLDPFAGTLTTLIAAARAHRPCVGVEIDDTYLAAAKSRLVRMASEITDGIVRSQNDEYPTPYSTPPGQTPKNNIEPAHVHRGDAADKEGPVTTSPVTSHASSIKERSAAAKSKTSGDALSSTPTRSLPVRTSTPHRSPPKRTLDYSPDRTPNAKKACVRNSPRFKKKWGGPGWNAREGAFMCAMEICILASREGATGHNCFTCEATVHAPCAGGHEEKEDIFCSHCLSQ